MTNHTHIEKIDDDSSIFVIQAEREIVTTSIIRTFIIKTCGILIVEVRLEMNLIEVGINGFNVNVD